MKHWIILTLALMVLIPATLFGQSTITGIVVDSLTMEPLPTATVYVNSTTLGTTTNNDGLFELKDVPFPCTVVFSFVGYHPQALDLTRNPGKLTIRLKPNIELPEVVVSGKENMISKEDLEYFRRMFLGDDQWGRNATIMNENVLMVDNQIKYTVFTRPAGRTSFRRQYYTNDVVIVSDTYIDTIKVKKRYFKAWAYEPLIIDLPMLGYEVHVDLVKFEIESDNAQTQRDLLGYFYYKPYEKLKKRRAKSIQENRLKAYYGSTQHFLRSFAKNQLTENGYVLALPNQVKKGKKTISTYLPVDINNYSISTSDNMMQVYGLNDKKFRVRYYHQMDGTPLNFRQKGKGIHLYSESWIGLLKDTCTFLKNGITIDNNIQLTGDMTKRMVGASLPDDYFPPVDEIKPDSVQNADYASQMIKFTDNIGQFNKMFPQEKVYLEFDNTAYFQGENIWYKAFVTNATTLERAPSGVLYVDFLAPTGQLLLQQKLKIVAGQADGAIPLLNAGTYQTREKQGVLAYPSGFYEIRAYTQNMLDFSPDAIFSRVIPVYTQPKFEGEYDRSHVESNQDNPLVEKLRGNSNNKKIKDVNVSFYPEGGDLIRGLPCRVAFKATGSDAFGIDGALKIPGVYDSVYTVHDGMGSFIITPRENENAHFVTPDGTRTRVSLPQVAYSGYSMMSDVLSDSLLQVNIWRTEDLIGELTALAVTCRGDVVYFKEITDVDNTQLDIDCSDWPAGVCRVTLFDKSGNILSSRSIFHSSDELSGPVIQVNTDSLSRKVFGKEVLDFQLTDQDGNPFRDRFCLSVRDATDYGGGQTDNLQTNLLLSSDLRGYIHDPAWYLESNDSIHREALNLLTMVQGWERYEWQTMTGIKEFTERHRIEEGLTMNGWVLSFRKREPSSDINVYAALTPTEDKAMFESYDYQTDSTGYFGFNLSDFYGKGTFTIHLMKPNSQGENKHERSKRIRFERGDRPAPRAYFLQETDLSHNTPQIDDYKVDFTDNDLTAQQRKKLGIMLDDVDIEAKSEKRRFIDYDTFTSFEAEEDSELELDQGEYTTDVEGYFLERGIRFDYVSEEEKLIEQDMNELSDYSSVGGESGGVNVDMHSSDNTIKAHFYVHDLDRCLSPTPYANPMKIDMIDVKSIIVYDEPKYPYDFLDLIPLEVEYNNKSINTLWFWWVLTCWERFYLVDIQIKQPNEMLFDWEIANLGYRTTTVKGFTKPVEFYAPEYPDGPIEGNIDPRRTLYWNPNVITDEEGRARVEFYNNNFTHRFTIRGTGITASGIPYILNQTW